MCFFILLMKLVYFADNLSYLLIIFCSFSFILFLLNINVWKMHLIQKFMIFKDDTWTDLDYIYLWKCWSYICSSKIIKNYWNIHFLHQIILFLFFNFSFLFFSFSFISIVFFFSQSKRLQGLRPRHVVVFSKSCQRSFACPPCGKNCFPLKYLVIS